MVANCSSHVVHMAKALGRWQRCVSDGQWIKNMLELLNISKSCTQILLFSCDFLKQMLHRIQSVRLMEKILYHLGCIKPCK